MAAAIKSISEAPRMMHSIWRKQKLASLLLLSLATVMVLRLLLRDGVIRNGTLDGKEHSDTSNIVWVEGTGSLLSRLHEYALMIAEQRTKIVGNALNTTQWAPLASSIHLVWGNNVDTIYLLEKQPSIKTVALKWLNISGISEPRTNLKDQSNLIVQDYYGWSATEPLCRWIKTPGYTKANWDVVYNRSCLTDPTLLFAKPMSLENLYFNSKPIKRSRYWPRGGLKYPEHFYTRLPSHVFYVHLIQNAIVDKVGDVFAGNLKIMPFTCNSIASSRPPEKFEESEIYDEVFVITQFWGDRWFHLMVESLPRMAPYLQFLRNNTSVRIHVADTNDGVATLMKLFGLDPKRLISGVCRAKLVFLPQGTYCGFAHVQGMQVLSSVYREIISKTFPQEQRKAVVVIRRTRTRKFQYISEIETAVKLLSQKYNLQYEVYPDYPMPSIEEAMRLFHRAVMVVGPHGAGLSNVLFSQPGTVVIEGVCNPPHVNMCYQRTAHILGLRYHGVPSTFGCEAVVNIDPEVISEVVETHMKLLIKSRQSQELLNQR